MTITQRALLQGMSDQLVNRGYMPPFANDDISFATFDKIAEITALPSLLPEPLPLAKAANLMELLIKASSDMAANGFGPSAERIANVKTAMAYDPFARAGYVAEHLMRKEADIEASSVTPVGQNTPTDEPSTVTQLDNKNRPPGMYENMLNRTALPEPGIIGREVTAAEKQAGSLGEFLQGLRGRFASRSGSSGPGRLERLRSALADSGPAHFAGGFRRPFEGAAELAAEAAAQKGMTPGPNPLWSPEELNIMHRGAQGAALRNQLDAAGSAVAGAARGAGSALATNPLTHVQNIRSGEGRGAAAAALGGQLALGGGAAAGLGAAGMAGYRALANRGGGAAPPEDGGGQIDPEILAMLSKQSSDRTADQRAKAREFLSALSQKVAGFKLTPEAKVAALGLGACGPTGLQVMHEVLGRAKTAAEADDELNDVLQVLQEQGVPVTPELLQALDAELGDAVGGMPPAGPPGGGMDAPPSPPDQEKEAQLRAELRKMAEGGSLLNAPPNTPTNQPDNVTKLDNKNRPPGKYEDKGPNSELSTAEGEIGAEKKAALLKLAQQYGPQLPAAASPEQRYQMIQKLAALPEDARTGYVRSLFGTAG